MLCLDRNRIAEGGRDIHTEKELDLGSKGAGHNEGIEALLLVVVVVVKKERPQDHREIGVVP